MPLINCIVIAVVSTTAIISANFMKKIEPENKWYVWYAAGINLISVFLHGWLVV